MLYGRKRPIQKICNILYLISKAVINLWVLYSSAPQPGLNLSKDFSFKWFAFMNERKEGRTDGGLGGFVSFLSYSLRSCLNIWFVLH